MDDDEFICHLSSVEVLFEAMIGSSDVLITHHHSHCSISPSPSPSLSPIRRRSYSPDEWRRKGEVDLPLYDRFPGKVNYSEEADKNARELIKEEEEARLRAKKKKAKKERQRQKKKYMNQIPENKLSNRLENMTPNNDITDMEGLDTNAKFMSKATTKVKNMQILPVKTRGKKDFKQLKIIVKKAKDFEKENNFKESIKYYSEAIDLAPKCPDIILKRSHIYYLLKRFEKSIRDAQKALVYSPNNPEAYLRIGEGNFALKNLFEAEAAFLRILNHDSYCGVAKERLFSVRVKMLEEMGYHPNEAFTALLKSTNKTLDEAVEYLTNLENGNVTTEDLYYSDDEEDDESYEESDEDYDDNEYDDENPAAEADENPAAEADENPAAEADENPAAEADENPAAEAEVKSVASFNINNNSPLLTDYTNPLGISSLFIGHLKKGIIQKEMQEMFIKFGELKGIKLSVDNQRTYAFVNYVRAVSASRAMQALQHTCGLLSTLPLIVRYPTNIVTTALASLENPHTLLRQYNTDLPSKEPTPVLSNKPAVLPPPPDKSEKNAPRLRPRPKTAECFYWRTYGCTFGKQCFNLHIPANKGIDCKEQKARPDTTRGGLGLKTKP